MTFFNQLYNSLFWRIIGIILGLLIILVFAYAQSTAYSANMYFHEVSQRLNAPLAKVIASDMKIFKNGHLETDKVKEIFHMTMIANPSIELYLLDTNGKILSYDNPTKTVQPHNVDLAPIKYFIKCKGKDFVMGDDPLNPPCKKIFSAARILENGNHLGYIYIILASEEYDSAMTLLMGSYITRAAFLNFIIALFAIFLVTMLIIWYLLRNLRTVSTTVRQFGEGDLSIRVEQTDSELAGFSKTFNKMADTIVSNMNELKEAETFQKELIANVSHDLRTPLAIIQGYAETMIMKKDSLSLEKQEHYNSIILKSTTKLQRLVEQLFEFSKLESNQIKPSLEPFFIQELVQDISHKYEILAKEKEIQLNIANIQDLPLILADISLIERVFQNLLDNAIKFTPKQGIITIQLTQLEKHIRLIIQDTGTGIPKIEQPFIFERYHKGSKENSTGLGLAIVKKILQLNHSKIMFSSIEKKGTTFYFDLPIYKTV